MSKYLVRLDDACEKWDIAAWDRMEQLLDRYEVKPLVGVIPCCQDPMMDPYSWDTAFWTRIDSWVNKGWTLALHGCNHVYRTISGGLNPVNTISEFVGEPLEVQREKIRRGMESLAAHGYTPQVFFAPAHTFDENTLEALRLESNIRVISDTVASDVYWKDGFQYIPLQSGHFCKLPVKIMTACFHPNVMKDADFQSLERFLEENRNQFVSCSDLLAEAPERAAGLYDRFLQKMYFSMRRIRRR